MFRRLKSSVVIVAGFFAGLVLASALASVLALGACDFDVPPPNTYVVSRVALPSSPAEAKGLLKASIRDDNPVIFLEHKRLYSVKGPAPEGDDVVIPLGKANVARAGDDLTIVSAGKGVADALAAAETLAEDGVDAEVVDLRTLRPLDGSEPARKLLAGALETYRQKT